MYNILIQEVGKMTKNIDNSLKNQVIAMSNTLAEKEHTFYSVSAETVLCKSSIIKTE